VRQLVLRAQQGSAASSHAPRRPRIPKCPVRVSPSRRGVLLRRARCCAAKNAPADQAPAVRPRPACSDRTAAGLRTPGSCAQAARRLLPSPSRPQPRRAARRPAPTRLQAHLQRVGCAGGAQGGGAQQPAAAAGRRLDWPPIGTSGRRPFACCAAARCVAHRCQRADGARCCDESGAARRQRGCGAAAARRPARRGADSQSASAAAAPQARARGAPCAARGRRAPAPQRRGAARCRRLGRRSQRCAAAPVAGRLPGGERRCGAAGLRRGVAGQRHHGGHRGGGAVGRRRRGGHGRLWQRRAAAGRRAAGHAGLPGALGRGGAGRRGGAGEHAAARGGRRVRRRWAHAASRAAPTADARTRLRAGARTTGSATCHWRRRWCRAWSRTRAGCSSRRRAASSRRASCRTCWPGCRRSWCPTSRATAAARWAAGARSPSPRRLCAAGSH
jgi:hypothetical protein